MKAIFEGATINPDNEIWKPVNGYEGLYEISKTCKQQFIT